MNYNINLDEMFSQENFNKYKEYFNIPKVVKASNKIVEAVKNTKELTYDENMASVMLAIMLLNQSK